MHMFVGTINKNKNIKGYLKNKLLIPEKIEERHEELVKEMQKRGMKHKSPLPKFKIPKEKGIIDIEYNFKDLMNRCQECKERILNVLPEGHPLRPTQ